MSQRYYKQVEQTKKFLTVTQCRECLFDHLTRQKALKYKKEGARWQKKLEGLQNQRG